MSPDLIRTLLPYMISLFAVTMLLIVWYSTIERDPLPARIKALEDRKRALKAGITGQRKRRYLEEANAFKELLKKLNLLKGQRDEKTALILMQAGFRSKDAPAIYSASKLVGGALAVFVAGVILFGLQVGELERTHRLIGVVFAGLLGFLLPTIYVERIKLEGRKKKMNKSLPDAFDLMVICAEAGLGMDAIFARVADEIGFASPELAEEIGITVVELGFLPDRKQALENLANRIPIDYMRSLVGSLQQSEKFGTPLAQSLRVLAQDMRHDRLMKAEEKAARLPVLLTMPTVLLLLPCIFMVIMGPASLQIMDAFVTE